MTGFDALYGLQYDHLGDGEVRAHVEIDDRHLQPAGLVHGGVYAALAESMASVGTWQANQGKFVAGMSNATTFLRPAFTGDTLTAVAQALHRGRTTWIWDVTVTGSAGKPVASSRVTIAVREPQQ